MSKSIIQDTKECLITHKTSGLHRHHIYEGNKNKDDSEDNGFWVYLIGELHNLSNFGVHMNNEFDTWLKKYCQFVFEKTHSRKEFMEIIGRNYLEDDEIVPNTFNPYYRPKLNVHSGNTDEWFGVIDDKDDWF